MSLSLAKAFDEGVQAASQSWKACLVFALAQWVGFFLLVGAGLGGILLLGLGKFLSNMKAMEHSLAGAPVIVAGVVLGGLFLALLGHVFLETGKTACVARALRGTPPGWADLLTDGGRFCLRGVGIIGWLLLLVVPLLAAAVGLSALLVLSLGKVSGGISVGLFLLFLGLGFVYVFVRLSFSLPALVASDVGARAALRESWDATQTHFWSALGLFLLYSLVMMIASLLLVVGGWALGKGLGSAGQFLSQLVSFAFYYFSSFALSGMLVAFHRQAVEGGEELELIKDTGGNS